MQTLQQCVKKCFFYHSTDNQDDDKYLYNNNIYNINNLNPLMLSGTERHQHNISNNTKAMLSMCNYLKKKHLILQILTLIYS